MYSCSALVLQCEWAVTGFHKVRSQIVSVHAMMAFDGG
jgi:predicted small metal-binding protein